MKKKILLIAVVIMMLLVWYFLPASFLQGENGERVSSIQVFNATNGYRFTIEEDEAVSCIVERIREQSFRKRELSLFMKGSLYHLSFRDEAGKELETLIVNSDKWIRKDPFSYSTDGDMEMIDHLRLLEENRIIAEKE